MFASNRKGISSCALARQIGVRQKTAWSILKRIRFLFSELDDEGLLDGIVEVDEAYFGGREKNKHLDKKLFDQWPDDKQPVMGLRTRDGEVRVKPMDRDVESFVRDNVKEGAVVFTDGHTGYDGLGGDYEHKTVNHSRHEYVRGIVSINSVESTWAVMKRGYVGTYHDPLR